MKPFKRIIALAALTLILVPVSDLSARDYSFQRFPAGKIIPSKVTCFVEDSRGNMWIGSKQEGLARYSENSSKLYLSDSTVANSLPGDTVYELFRDKNNDIWAVTSNGAAKYSFKYDNFETLQILSEDGKMVNAFTRCGLPTDEGIIFGSRGKLYFYAFADHSFKQLTTVESGGEGWIIHGIFKWTDGKYLLWSKEHGVMLYDLSSNQISKAPFDFGETTRIFVDSKCRVWRVVANNGLECYSPDGSLTAYYNMSNSAMSHNVVLCMAENNGKLWFGTDGGGIDVFDDETGQFTVISRDDKDPYSFPETSINTLYFPENSNVCWAGLVRNGFVVVHDAFVKTYSTFPNNFEGSLGSSAIQWMWGDSDKLWLATDGSGLVKFGLNDKKFKFVKSTAGKKVVSCATISNDKLLMYCYGEGLFMMNKGTETIYPVSAPHPDLRKRMESSLQNVCIISFDNKVMFFADAIYISDSSLGQAKKLEIPVPDDVNSLVPVFGSSKYDFWVVDASYIFKFDSVNQDLTLRYKMPGSDRIKSATVTPDGELWLATTRGIGRFDEVKNEFRPVETNLFHLPMAIICDTYGRLWIGSSNSGLFVYLRENGTFIVVDESDGANMQQFLPGPKYIASTNEIILAGLDGMVEVDPAISFFSASNLKIELESVEIDGQRYTEENFIKVPRNAKLVTVNAFVSGDNILRKKNFRFKIDGGDLQYEVESPTANLQLRSLPPGTHKVFASFKAKHGQWSEWTEIMTLRVLRPWYLRWWAIVLYIAIIAIGGYTYLRIRRKKNEEEMASNLDKEKIKFLMNVNHEIRTPLTLVSAPIDKMLDTLDPSDPNYRRFRNASNQLRRIKTLINTVLIAHKLEDGITGLSTAEDDINKSISAVAEEFRDEIEARGIKYEVLLDPSAGRIVFDQEKIGVVLRNILINAMKHSPDGKGITVETQRDASAGVVRVSVTDDGDGLEGVDPQQLFKRFYQGTAEKTGSGIGMSYCKIIMDKHNGKIGARNHATRGATFFFELPI